MNFMKNTVVCNMLKYNGLCILVCLCCLSSAFASTGEKLKVETFLQDLETQHKTTMSLGVRFKQEKFFSFMDRPVVSQGRLFFLDPGKVRFELVRPFGSVMLNDGKKLSRFELSDGKWEQVKFGASNTVKLMLGQICQWLQGKYSKQSDIFDFSIRTDDPNSYAVLTLTPKDKRFREHIKSIEVFTGKPPEFKVIKLTINEPDGDSTHMIFSDEVINCKISDKVFSEPGASEQCREILDKSKPPKKEKD